MDANTEYENCRKRMEKFPSAFNLAGADKVTMSKFRSIQHNLNSELDINDNCENERIIKLNLLTWVRFRLGEEDGAVELSNDAAVSTGRRNVASLGNRFFVMWQTGDELEAKKCLKDLENMKLEENFLTLKTDAQAEQAYYYTRLGGPNNLKRAIDIFSALPETPINYLRKFGCGLVYRRITHVNIVCSSSKPLTVPDYQRLAVECLFEVAVNADRRLKSLAYAQLVNLRRCYKLNLSAEDKALFRGLEVTQLCEKALEHGENIPTVLTQCGKAIKPIDIDKAIEWLKKSVEIKDNSPAYHHLGICYKRKAEQAARGIPHPQNTSEELRDHNCMGQREAESHVTVESHGVSRTSGDEHPRPADGSTAYHQANSAEMHVMMEYPQVNYTREHGSTRRGNGNDLPQYMGGRYGQVDDQTRQSSNRYGKVNYQHRETNYQHLPSNCQYQRISGHRGYMMDEYGYLSHLPSQVKYTHGHDSYNPQQSNYTHTQMNDRPLDMSQTLGQACGQTTYMVVDGGHWDHQNVKVDRAIRNNNCNGRTYSGGRWEPKPQLKSSLRRCRSVIPLNKDDENVQKAFDCFEKAIKIAKENLPAALDLGLLLKETNQMDEALKQFNSITNNSYLSIGHRVTVISAFEQAGLCCRQLSLIGGNNDYEEMAKYKLIRAVSMAADLALIMPELQGSHKDVWVAFTTLITEIDKEQIPKNLQLQKKIKVLELAREYGDIVDVIQKLKELGQEGLTNPDIIKTALDSYLKLGQPDNALGFHNLVSINPAVKDSDWWNANPMRNLRIKVWLHAISGRLGKFCDNPTVLFQQLFELVFGSCFGLHDPENDQQNATDSVVFGDVLFVFDTDESPDDESVYPTVNSARCLKRLCTWLFGLETQENMKGTGEFGDQSQIQLNEMLKYQVVIIVLGEETRNRLFNAMLERVSYNKREKAPPNQKILVIDAGLHDGKIPQYLQQFKSLKLEDIGILDQLQAAPESWSDSDHISFTDIINHVDVDAVLKLFCFMIEHTWPCP